MSRFFINRPIVAMVIAILTVILGAISMLTLPVAQFPEIVPPEVTIGATYLGADAQTIEQSVAAPIEQQMTGVDNMAYMVSTNTNAGGMSLRVTFDVKTQPNTNLILTQEGSAGGHAIAGGRQQFRSAGEKGHVFAAIDALAVQIGRAHV